MPCDRLVTLRIRFWGTRGSIPAPGPHTVRYGGNTPCVEVRSGDGSLVILDAGTGIRALGNALASSATTRIAGDLFVSHSHSDHVHGLPFFSPLYASANCFTIWSAPSMIEHLERAVREQMSAGSFPVAFETLAATIDFRALGPNGHMGSGYQITPFDLRHPGGAIGYRLHDPADLASSLVYVSDNELGAVDGDAGHSAWREALVEFVRGARVLVHDATYTDEEYERHRGWGHSRVGDVVALALDAGVERLFLYHHKPDRDDDGMDACVARARETVRRAGGTLVVDAAAEGMEREV